MASSRGGSTLQLRNIYDGDTADPSPHFGSFGGAGRSVPQFVARDSGNVSAILGKAATLTCRVRAVGNRTVSITDMHTMFDDICLETSAHK